MIISVIGLGYIGLPTAAILTSNNVNVTGVDVNQEVVDTINTGNIHIAEPGLEILIRKAVNKKLLKAIKEPEKADVFMIAVPTPFKKNNEPDLSYIKSASIAIAPLLKKGNLIILESTSPVGTTEKLIEWLKNERPELSFPVFGSSGLDPDISVAHCPERVLPGYVMSELVKNDRVIGGVTRQCAIKAEKIYKIFVEGRCFITDSRTAELTKLVENSFRDLNIAFANELSLICDKLNINVWEMISLANKHPRVNILKPGPGVGGHCIAVDPWFIVDSAPNEAKLIRTARQVNDLKPSFVLNKVVNSTGKIAKNISEISIACFGLTFKPDIDDLRESPALGIAKEISLMGFKEVFLVEPNISNVPEGFKSIKKLSPIGEALSYADIVVLLVDHIEFKSIDLNLLSGKYIVDTLGIWS